MTKKDLLKTGTDGSTFIEIAHRNGKLADVSALLAKAGDPLTAKDMESAALKKFADQLNKDFYAAVTQGDLKQVKPFLALGIVDLGYSPILGLRAYGTSFSILTNSTFMAFSSC